MSLVLETNNLGISFGGLVALENLNVKLEREEILGIVGPNGAGKTTFLNLISGVYLPTQGNIFFKEKRIDGLKPYVIASLGISRTFQNIRLIPFLSVLENVMLGRAIQVNETIWSGILLNKKAKEERQKWVLYVEELIDYMGLSDVIGEDAVDLPYGTQRKVEIARAIASGAELILLDEPGAGMSAKEKQELVTFIKDVRARMHKTIIIIEHDMKMIGSLVDRAIVLNFGRYLTEGPVDKIKVDPQVITAYLGEGVC
jgi:branched-chain amino acid transport system ATP-binding protein